MKITRMFLAITTACVILFDIAIVLISGEKATISYQVWTIAYTFPFLPYACGVLMSHFFAPDYFAKKIPKLRYFIWIPISCLVLFLSIKFTPEINRLFSFMFGMVIGSLWCQEELKDG